jgi:hypothetical protein
LAALLSINRTVTDCSASKIGAESVKVKIDIFISVNLIFFFIPACPNPSLFSDETLKDSRQAE